LPVTYFPFKWGFGIIVLLKWVSKTPHCRRWRLATIEDLAGIVLRGGCADVAQSAEHPPCKRAVTSSILVVGLARKC
jgi:hypothetical protein